MAIEKVETKDAEALTLLTRRSKAYWGYSQKQIEQWHDELLITEDYIHENEVYLIRHEGSIVGYYSYFELEKGFCKLDNLFVEPDFIGAGFGKSLMTHFLNQIRMAGFKKASLDAEPKATAFYQRFGFQIVDQLQSSIPGRTLPIMELDL